MAALALLTSQQASAAELEVNFRALERHLGQQLFTQEGRKYFQGTTNKSCNYAYLENPHFEAHDKKLRILTKFSGRRAWNVFGKCVGLGDSFDLAIEARPFYQNGDIRFADVSVETGNKDGLYIRRARAEIQRTLSRDFKYEVLHEAKRIVAEQRGPSQKGSNPFDLELQSFQVTNVVVTDNALIFAIDFHLTLK